MIMKHVTIQSRDLDKSVKFYEEICGLQIQAEIRGKGPVDIVFLANGEGETCIEIIGNKDAAYEGKGISVGFQVPDVKAYHDKLEAEGYEVTGIISPNPVTEFFFVKDPDGVQIQFIN